MSEKLKLPSISADTPSMNATQQHEGFAPTEFAIALDTGNVLCRRVDRVAAWVQQWDGVDAPLALYSDVTDTHSYVARVDITGRDVRWDSARGAWTLRVRVVFADPEVGTVLATMIKVGGGSFQRGEVAL